jgi:uncharacterized protein YggE
VEEEKNPKRYKILLAAVVLIAGFFAATFAASSSLTSNASAQIAPAGNDKMAGEGGEEEEKTLAVSGSASAKVQPDKAQLVFAVDTREKTARTALDSNAATINAVLDALEAAGVKKNETSTADFNINSVYNYSSQGELQNLTGYTVTNSVLVSSSNLNSVSRWIDAAVSAGANRINGVYFQLSAEKAAEMRDGLITNAIKDARNKADLAAGAVGLKVVGVKSMTVNDYYGYVSGPYASKFTLAVADPSATPIIAANQDVSASVNIVYLLV